MCQLQLTVPVSSSHKQSAVDAVEIILCLHVGLCHVFSAAVDSGFKCTFCGAAVAMTQQQRIQQAQQQQQQVEEGADGSSSGPDNAAAAAAAAAAAQAEAVAFKDRLVDYDRHSQKRTTVIDDQSDFFEIETNAWLSEEVRAWMVGCVVVEVGVCVCVCWGGGGVDSAQVISVTPHSKWQYLKPHG